MKLLCVDTNAVHRHMIDIMLAPTGIEVDFATNSQEALEAYQSTEYDAVLLDMRLPDMSGLQTAREIRQVEGGFHLGYTPILFMGSPLDEANFDNGLDAGGDGHLMKPFTTEALFGALDQVMRNTNGHGLQGVLRATR